MTQEALKLALEALENSDKLINGSGNHFGLEGAMDGYYSGCFDVDGNNKLLNEAITAIKEALAQEQEPVALQYSKKDIDWQHEQQIKAQASTQPQRTEQNFCSRCGKRTTDLTTIHTCTPPHD